MKPEARISSAVIKRMPRYRRYLNALQKKGIDKISSREFSSLTGCTASQIRQDFNNFGVSGQQGYGYNVAALHDGISAILGLDRDYTMVIVGGGNLGQAIANYTHAYKFGFVVTGIFEINPRLVGLKVNDIEVLDYDCLSAHVREKGTDIGIICTTADNAQEVADRLCRAGIKGIWNFAPVDLVVSEGVAVENAHLSDSLHALAYYINKGGGGGP